MRELWLVRRYEGVKTLIDVAFEEKGDALARAEEKNAESGPHVVYGVSPVPLAPRRRTLRRKKRR